MNEWMLRNRERLIAGAAASSWMVPAAAAAQLVGKPEGVPQQFTNFEQTIRSAFNIIIVVAGIIFVILFLIGGVQYLTAAGNEDNTKKARQLMLDAIIGLVIVVTAWAVGTYVLQLLGISQGPGLPTRPN